jgi:hypothetical protein
MAHHAFDFDDKAFDMGCNGDSRQMLDDLPCKEGLNPE